jgi:uncharacterized protein with PQ loop repeat
MKTVLKYIPWIGFALMQAMNIPNVIKAIQTGVSMPIASVTMLIIALCCYLADAINRKCHLHIVSSIIGIVSNVVVLWFIL